MNLRQSIFLQTLYFLQQNHLLYMNYCNDFFTSLFFSDQYFLPFKSNAILVNLLF